MGTRWRTYGTLVALVAITAAACSATDPGVLVGDANSVTTQTGKPDPVDTTPGEPDPTAASEPEPDSTAPPFSVAPVPDGEIPIDDEIIRGTLDNGMAYYIRENDRPGAQLELRLAINAGSGLEADDQSAVAHFLEHMLFNGTEKYPKNELISELQKQGSEFGADINAYTSFDETVYMLAVPNEEESTTTGLEIMHQWLTAATIDPQEVVKERGVVLDEWRRSEESGWGRISVQIEDVLLSGTAYEGRNPIGLSTAIESMTPEVLRRFYDAWYRPDNAALVVVGDFDAEEMETRVKELFGPVEARAESPEPREELQWIERDGPQVLIAHDADLTESYAEFSLPHQATIPADTVSSQRDQLTQYIALQTLANRLSDDVRRGEAEFTSAEVSSVEWVRTMSAPSLMITSSNAQAGAGYNALLDELARVVQYGFSDSEVARVVDSIRSQAEAGYEARDTTQDARYADQYVEHFLTGAAIPNADDQFALTTMVLDELDGAGVTDAFLGLYEITPPLLLLYGGDEAAGLPSETDALAELAAVGRRQVSERADAGEVGDTLMDRPAIDDEGEELEYAGDPRVYLAPTYIEFANGAQVLINRTDIVDNFVSLHIVGPGGLTAVADDDVAEVYMMNEVVPFSGVGDLDAVQVDQILGASTVEVFPYPSYTEEFFGGETSTDDLELALQWIHQSMIAPRVTQAAFDTAIERNVSMMSEIDADPDLAAQLALDVARYGDTPRFRSRLTLAELETVTPEDVERVWKDRFGNAGDFVWVISGDIDVDATIELAQSYIATLPGSADDREVAKDIIPPPPSGVIRQTVEAGTGEKASLSVLFTEPSDESAQEQVYAELLGHVLSTRLTAHIREERGATYSPNASTFVTTEPTPWVVTSISVSGSPDDMALIAELVQQDITALGAEGPTDDEFEGAVAELENSYGYVSNGVLTQVLAASIDDPDAIGDYVDRAEVLADISIEELTEFAKRVLDPTQYIEITQLPR